MTDNIWNWIWPLQGATPINHGLDSEMFDRTDYPYSETFVREAIQNSLDARLDPSRPVTISFSFHQANLGNRRPFLQQAVEYRKKAGYKVPNDWDSGTVTWVVIEDSNAKGLSGDLDKRMDDFWNYWLNFGISNKDGSGRGGRGIGRVTFLIASQMQTVLGLTRRSSDGKTAACGMCVLKAWETEKNLYSTHAYLAEEIKEFVYRLHSSTKFHQELEKAFQLTGYGETESGLALVIPFPHAELNPKGIIASAVEHFAPAILNGTLIVKVDDETLDDRTIESVSEKISPWIHAEPIQDDAKRYLDLIKKVITDDVIEVPVTDFKSDMADHRASVLGKSIQKSIAQGESVNLRISLPLERGNKTETVFLKAIVSKAPDGKLPIDSFFREGMCLPDVKSKNPGEIDVLILVDDLKLATYLNLCEGKAHLDLLESKDVKAKLEERGYNPNCRLKRFIKALPYELRNLAIPEITEPDADIFAGYFSIPNEAQEDKPKPKPNPPKPNPDFPPPKIPVMLVETLPDGFRVRANPKYNEWPVNVSVTIAYADGSRKPGWSEFDFKFSDLKTSHNGCAIKCADNKIQATECGENCAIEVTGFDAKRELDTRIKVWKHAQKD